MLTARAIGEFDVCAFTWLSIRRQHIVVAVCFVLKWPTAVASRPARLFDERWPACLGPRSQSLPQIREHQRCRVPDARIPAGTTGQVRRELQQSRQTSILFSRDTQRSARKGEASSRLGRPQCPSLDSPRTQPGRLVLRDAPSPAPSPRPGRSQILHPHAHPGRSQIVAMFKAGAHNFPAET